MAFNDKLINITPQLSQIKTGTPLIKVGSDYIVGGIGGNFIPGSSQGSSMAFYRCTSVDASNSTWTGRKAVLVQGVYQFQSNSTTGLTYTSVKPSVGYVYSYDGLIKAASLWTGIPTDGLVFHASLSKAMNTSQTGQTINTSGSISYHTYKGIPCVYVSNGSYLYMNDTSILPKGNAPYTLSGWGNCQQYSSSYFGSILGYGICNQGGQGVNIAFWGTKEGAQYTNILIHHHDRVISDPSLYTTDKWYHVATTFDGSTEKLYVDGQLVATGQYTLNLQQTYFRIGYAQFDYYFNGYIAGDRIYDRALSATQVGYLAKQFTPTA